VSKIGRPPKWPKRQLIDGIRWRIRVGAPWRDVPDRYGPWQTVYGLFRRWQRDGTWAHVLTRLQTIADAADQIAWDVSVDSTIMRAHQHAAGARREGSEQVEPPGGVVTEPADHALGRSRGGWTTKLHLACEQHRRPLAATDSRSARGQSAVHRRVGRDPGTAVRCRPGAHATGSGAGGQGLQLPGEPGLPA